MSIPVSVRKGSTPDNRLILSSSTATADPAASDKGWSLDGADWTHIYAEFPGTVTEVRATPWFWSSVAEQWFEGDQMVLVPTDKFSLVETRGEERLFLVIDSISGSGTVKFWAAVSFDGRQL